MANELMVLNDRGLVLNNLAEIKEVAGLIAASGLAPKDMDRAEKIVVAILFGKELGLPPMASLQNIAVINGRPCVWGDAMLGIVEGTGQLDDIEETVSGDGENMTATCTVTRHGRKPHTQTFSMADAKRAGLAGKQGPWSQYPKRMLGLRARAFALRNTFADALKGIPVAEEVRDTIDVTPLDPRPSTDEPAPEREPMTKDERRETLLAALLKAAAVREMSLADLDALLVEGKGKKATDMTARELTGALSYLRQCYPDKPEEAPVPVTAPKTEPTPVANAVPAGLPSYWMHPKVAAACERLTDEQLDRAKAWMFANKPTSAAFVIECNRIFDTEQ